MSDSGGNAALGAQLLPLSRSLVKTNEAGRQAWWRHCIVAAMARAAPILRDGADAAEPIQESLGRKDAVS
jgi:hypothetical protein